MEPSIFNDVLGPVMRGPSSSHSAAANRIGRICRDLVGGDVASAIIDYDPSGSLVTTHAEQGTDMGLYGGFLGWTAEDPRLPDFARGLEEAGIQVTVRYVEYGATHPNTYRIALVGRDGSRHAMTAISTGGGMIRIESVDGAPVSLGGDAYETLLYLSSAPDRSVLDALAIEPGVIEARWCPGERPFALVRTRQAPAGALLSAWQRQLGVHLMRVLQPVLPILAGSLQPVPFLTAEAMLEWNADRELELWELAVAYESARGGLSQEAVRARTREVLSIFEGAIRAGRAGTEYHDRILPAQAPGFQASLERGDLVAAGAMNRMILYVSSVLEVKSSMGVIVAAPTAGSCGTLPGAVLGVADHLGLDEEVKVRAILVSGLIGVFIAHRATFAAEVGGCMAECGSASGMAAAAIVSMMGGSVEEQLGAASMALQNSFGMICDPIGNRVEAPCLGRNTMAATNALAAANMTLAGYRHLIPLDEVLAAMDAVGRALPHELCCTAKGGLSVTPTSLEIARRLGQHALPVLGVKPGC